MPANPGAMPQLRNVEKHVWHIFGQVTDFNGQPLRGAHVHIDLGHGMTYFRDVQADVQGRFKTQYELEYTTFKTITA
jgi:protocatechuate 3,4-dioxygenase beta subunit